MPSAPSGPGFSLLNLHMLPRPSSRTRASGISTGGRGSGSRDLLGLLRCDKNAVEPGAAESCVAPKTGFCVVLRPTLSASPLRHRAASGGELHCTVPWDNPRLSVSVRCRINYCLKARLTLILRLLLLAFHLPIQLLLPLPPPLSLLLLPER